MSDLFITWPLSKNMFEQLCNDNDLCNADLAIVDSQQLKAFGHDSRDVKAFKNWLQVIRQNKDAIDCGKRGNEDGRVSIDEALTIANLNNEFSTNTFDYVDQKILEGKQTLLPLCDKTSIVNSVDLNLSIVKVTKDYSALAEDYTREFTHDRPPEINTTAS